MNTEYADRKSRRRFMQCAAERSARREPARANSLGRVVPAAWTALGIASAAIPWSKPAGAGCAPLASTERFGFPGFLNVSRGGQRTAVSMHYCCIRTCMLGDPYRRMLGCIGALGFSHVSSHFFSHVSAVRSCRHPRSHLGGAPARSRRAGEGPLRLSPRQDASS